MAWLCKATIMMSLLAAGIAGVSVKADNLPSTKAISTGQICDGQWQAHAEENAALGQRLTAGLRPYPVSLWRALMFNDNQVLDGGYPEASQPSWWHEGDFWSRVLELDIDSTHQGSIDYHRNFNYAVALFDERVSLLGKDHPYIRDWMLNQIDVFKATEPEAERPFLRGHYAGPVQQLAQDDLRYQLAAADFYAGNLDAAQQNFLAISQDTQSRYQLVSRYMLARMPADAGNAAEALAEIDRVEQDSTFADLRIVERQLLGVISWNDTLDSIAGRRLILLDGAYLQQPANLLEANKTLQQAYDQAFEDLRYFIGSDKAYFDNLDTFTTAISQTPVVGQVDGQKALDFLTWLQATSTASHLATGSWLGYLDVNLRSDEYRQKVADIYKHVQVATGAQKLAWTITFAMRAIPGIDHVEIVSQTRKEIAQRMRDCSASIAEQIAYGVLRYHDLRLQLMNKDASTLADHLTAIHLEDGRLTLFSSLEQNQAARYLIAMGRADLIADVVQDLRDPEIRIIMARSLTELRQAISYAKQHNGFGNQSPTIATLMNLLPLTALETLIGDNETPQTLRKPLARIAWMRAYLTQNQTALIKLTAILAQTNPDLAPALADYRTAWTLRQRHLALLKMLLRTPLMTTHFGDELFYTKDLTTSGPLDPHEGNWWCRFNPDEDLINIQREFFDDVVLQERDPTNGISIRIVDTVNFDGPVTRQLNEARQQFLANNAILHLIDPYQLDALRAIPTATIYLGRRVVAWARQRSWLSRQLYGDDDLEIASALAQIVRMTRWGCRHDESTAVISSRTYGLLHQLFPDSDSAKQTPYWYDTGLPPQ